MRHLRLVQPGETLATVESIPKDKFKMVDLIDWNTRIGDFVFGASFWLGLLIWANWETLSQL